MTKVFYTGILFLVFLGASFGYKTDQMFEVSGITTVLFFLFGLFGFPFARLWDEWGDFRLITSSFLSAICGCVCTWIVYGLRYAFS